jgi:hypothetical protein
MDREKEMRNATTVTVMLPMPVQTDPLEIAKLLTAVMVSSTKGMNHVTTATTKMGMVVAVVVHSKTVGTVVQVVQQNVIPSVGTILP